MVINLYDKDIITPGFVYDEGAILGSLSKLSRIRDKSGCKILFPLKPFAFADALSLMSAHVDGFSASSLFEAKLAREVLGDQKSVHLTTPGLRPDEINEISELCDYISFNSLSQWERLKERMFNQVSCGLRLNPQMSFVEDGRYDPCKKNSKLGIALGSLHEISDKYSERLQGIVGLHFHTNCESTDFNPLFQTIQRIESRLPNLFPQIQWINLGGGYLFDQVQTFDKLYESISYLKEILLH